MSEREEEDRIVQVHVTDDGQEIIHGIDERCVVCEPVGDKTVTVRLDASELIDALHESARTIRKLKSELTRYYEAENREYRDMQRPDSP